MLCFEAHVQEQALMQRQIKEFGLSYMSLDRPDIIDAGITSYGNRDRIVALHKRSDESIVGLVDRPRVTKLPKKVSRLSMSEQHSTFKFVVYVEGHAAALRYLELMLRGFVIFKIKSTTKSPDLWFFNSLKDGEDHVGSCLKDLPSAIEYVKSLPDLGFP